MREMSYQTSTQESQQTKQFRGGEKKVMKKRLALLLSVAMAFSMFANVAFGADEAKTTQEKFDALKQQEVFNGYPDGTAGLDKDMTRAEFAKVVVKLFGLKEVHGVYSYNDKNYGPKNWAAPFIEAVTAEGLMQGKDLTKKLFDFNGKITVEETAKTLVEALKLPMPKDSQNNASAWAKDYFQAAVDAGLIAKDANPKANATRTQLVEAAYAADQLLKGPKVESYKVVDSKHIEFTMSDKEVVKVELEKALEPNKETEVKFTYNNKEYTHKVTHVITSAQKVESVTAENLKEVVVKFDGSVDKRSAERKENYEVKDRKIDTVTLSSDNRTATILLEEADSSTMKNQKETELKVKGVQNEDKSKKFEQTIKFTPVDVQTPEVKEVVGLGTKAFKVVFSEPVKKSGVYSSSNYKVDGKTVGANVTYIYPNVAIVSTDLSVGEHKITVSNIEDFSGLKIAPVENTFTVAEDTTAPEVVGVTAKDPMELEIEFNETVKSVDKIYHGNSNNTGVVTYKDNKVTVKFSKDKALNMGENTIYIDGVKDYSDNKANRTAKVNPSLDSERPEIEKVEVKQNDHKLVLTFSKKLDRASAEDKNNYVLKDKDGKTFTHTGLESKTGHPIMKPTYNEEKKTVEIDLMKKLDSGDYTLEVSGVKDTAYVSNTMLPYSQTFNADAVNSAARAWVSQDSNDDNLYVQFPKAVKTDGDGNALVKAKYTIAGKSLSGDFEDPELIQSDTVRIRAKRGTFLTSERNQIVFKDGYRNVKTDANGKPVVDADGNTVYVTPIEARLVKDIDGDFFKEGDNYTITIKDVSEDKVNASVATASSREELKVELTGKLSKVDVGDFKVVQGSNTYRPNDYRLSDNKDVLYLKFTDNNKLPAGLEKAYLETAANRYSQDTFGNTIGAINVAITDEINPEATSFSVSKVSVTDATYKMTVKVDAKVYTEFAQGDKLTEYYKNLFKVELQEKGSTEQKATINHVKPATTADGAKDSFEIEFKLPAGVTLKDTTVVRLSYDNTGTIKVIRDIAGNALKEIQLAAQFDRISE
ncbi:Ig-like domain-containing protein [Paenibacillus apiarius]|uniref:Ig-like domain-containing protein n=1 Tax=Paenibacillus apiarius TaxID=46240 RepID=UPI001981BBEA|nr:Ig-like domain-containing protein [Paenibacillus apiarius]MBN3523893.1 S-layer homology domain-containing protein [Paenibacillus apiarius]